MASCQPEEVNSSFALNDTDLVYSSPAQANWYEYSRTVLTRFVIPSTLSFGIVGNALNLGLFGHRFGFRGHQMELLERSALAGLTALAVSDLLFCVVGVLKVALPPLPTVDGSQLIVVTLYFSVYQPALQNWLLFTSTWLTVVISVERFVVVGRPLKARWHLRTRNSVALYLCTYVVGGVVSVPLFLRNRISVAGRSQCPNLIFVESRTIFMETGFRTVYNVLWSLFGHVVPTILLAAANARLLAVLYRSRAAGIANPDRYGCTSITLTVVAIVFSFLLLVCPSMVVESVIMLSVVGLAPMPTSWKDSTGMLLAIAITNALQAIKFAVNFLLYCGVLKQFRKTINDVATCQRANSRLESLRSSVKPTPV